MRTRLTIFAASATLLASVGCNWFSSEELDLQELRPDSAVSTLGVPGTSVTIRVDAIRATDGAMISVAPRLLHWSTSDPAILAVANGVVTFRSKGEAWIGVAYRELRDSVLMQVISPYTVRHFLAMPDTEQLRRLSLNDNGVAAVATSLLGPGLPPIARRFLWTSGQVVDLPCTPLDINNRGQVLCESEIYDDGVLTPLTGAPGKAWAFNDAGQVGGLTSDRIPVPFIWTGANSVQLLERCTVCGPFSVAINNHGDVAVQSISAGLTHFHVHVGGQPTPTGIGYVYGINGSLNAIADSRIIAGSLERDRARPGRDGGVWLPNGAGWKWVWIPQRDGGRVSEALGAGGDGLVIGGNYVWSTVSQHGTTSIAHLLGDKNWTITTAIAINEKGQIAATAKNPSGQLGIALLDPAS